MRTAYWPTFAAASPGSGVHERERERESGDGKVVYAVVVDYIYIFTYVAFHSSTGGRNPTHDRERVGKLTLDAV